MAAQRRRDTGPEISLRKRLHALGCRFRVDFPLPGSRRRGDIVFTRRRVVVFIDGCFWHACPLHGTTPKRNRDWWVEKLRGNVERDRRADRELLAAGWTVLRIWEHESIDAATDRVLALVVLRTPRAGESR